VERVTEYRNSIGNGVIIRAEDGSLHIFGHLDKVSVSPGDPVHPGTFLGTSGNSGNVFSSNGAYQDPSGIIEKVDAMAGAMGPFKGTGVITDWIISKTREKAKETATDTILGVWDAIIDIIGNVEHSVFLVGTGVLIILRACGFKHPWIRPGVMMALHVLLRCLLGGLAA
jgi:hypothetical protein